MVHGQIASTTKAKGRAVMLAVLATVMILAVVGLGYYAVSKMRPGSFMLQTSVCRLFSFRVEVLSGDLAPDLRNTQPSELDLRGGPDIGGLMVKLRRVAIAAVFALALS